MCHLQSFSDHFDDFMIESDHNINPLFRWPWPKVRGAKWSAQKGLQNGHFYVQIFAKNFDTFFNFFNFDHFRRRFTTFIQSLQKKGHISWWSPRKNEDFVNITFLIFKLLSDNFLTGLWGDFQFSLKMTILIMYESFWALNK